MSILGHHTRATSIYYAHIDRAAQTPAIREYGQALMGWAHP